MTRICFQAAGVGTPNSSVSGRSVLPEGLPLYTQSLYHGSRATALLDFPGFGRFGTRSAALCSRLFRLYSHRAVLGLVRLAQLRAAHVVEKVDKDRGDGRLEHGMKAGLEGLRKELRQAREGAKALGGYRDATRDLGRRIERDA